MILWKNVLPVGCVLLMAAACPTRPLEHATVESVQAIVVSDHNGHQASIRDAAEIELFLTALRVAKPFKEGKVTPEFELVVRLTDGQAVNLRMDKTQIGPDVRASDVVWRWRLENDAAYRIVSSALSRPQ